MALTADQVVVMLRAETQQYQQNMRSAAQAATQFDLKSTTALNHLDKSFSGLTAGAVKMSADVSRALDKMAAGQAVQKMENQLDSLIRKQLEFGRMTPVVSGNLPGLGGLSFGADPFKPVSDSAENAGKQIGMMRGNIGNIAAQFNDIGVTAAMGMNPMLIALQQGTQLSQVFAGQKLGDVAKGLGAAFASVVSPISLVTLGLVAVTAAVVQWGMSALASGRDTKSLEEALKGVKDAIGAVRDATQNLAGADLAGLQEKYGKLTAEVWRLIEAQKMLAEVDARKALQDLRATVEEFTSARWYDLGLSDMGAAIPRLQSQLQVTRNDATLLYEALTDIANAKAPDEQAEAYARARDYMLTILRSQEESTDEAIRLTRQLIEGEDATRQLANASAAIPSNLDAAATSASGLANELLRAVGAAQQLANAGISDLRRAQIELDFRTDPVGRATALARERFDASAEIPDGAPPEVASEIEKRRRAYVDEQTEAAKLLLTRDQLNEADREAERLANRKGRGGGAKTTPQQRAVERFDDRIMKEIEGLNAEAQALAGLSLGFDEYGNAVSAARKEAELLQELQNKGVQLTPALRVQVAGLAEDWRIAADAAAVARERHDEFQKDLEGFKSTGESAFKGLITGAENFSSALSKVLDKLADMLLSSAFDKIWGAGLGGASTGFLGKLFGFQTGGYTGSGSASQPAGIVHKGEYVMSAPAVHRIGLQNLEALHRGGSMGGGPKITINNNASGVDVSADYVTRDEVVLTVSQAIAQNTKSQGTRQYLSRGR